MEIIVLPALKDNYIFLIFDNITKNTIAIDPALAEPVLNFLHNNNAKLTHILNTHHHNDHIGGNNELKTATGANIVASKYDQHRIDNIDKVVKDGDEIEINGIVVKVIFTPGHTSGHIAYYAAQLKSLFCGDTLFSLGCGRLFEGTAAEMYESLEKFKALPDDTLIYAAHEYTENNAKFAITIEPNNEDLITKMSEVVALRTQGKFTIPSILAQEKKCNPFLRCNSIENFTQMRIKKDNF